ncbi:hypothetical protein [Parvimonas micra]
MKDKVIRPSMVKVSE